MVYNLVVPDSSYHEIPANHGIQNITYKIILDLRINFVFQSCGLFQRAAFQNVKITIFSREGRYYSGDWEWKNSEAHFHPHINGMKQTHCCFYQLHIHGEEKQDTKSLFIYTKHLNIISDCKLWEIINHCIIFLIYKVI